MLFILKDQFALCIGNLSRFWLFNPFGLLSPVDFLLYAFPIYGRMTVPNEGHSRNAVVRITLDGSTVVFYYVIKHATQFY